MIQISVSKFYTKLKEYISNGSVNNFLSCVSLSNTSALNDFFSGITKVFASVFQNDTLLEAIAQDPHNRDWETTGVLKFFINQKIMGHVDHGKTTTTSALSLLSELQCKFIDEKTGGKYSSILSRFKQKSVSEIHGAKESKERGVTINITTLNLGFPILVNFKGREVLLLIEETHTDCPGHVDYIKNAILGSGRPDIILITCDANGANLQTSEHIKLSDSNGHLMDDDKDLLKLIVFVNKLDMLLSDQDKAKPYFADLTHLSTLPDADIAEYINILKTTDNAYAEMLSKEVADIKSGLIGYAEIAVQDVVSTCETIIKSRHAAKANSKLDLQVVYGSGFNALDYKNSHPIWLVCIAELVYEICNNKIKHVLMDAANGKLAIDSSKSYLYIESLFNVARGTVCAGVLQEGSIKKDDKIHIFSSNMKKGEGIVTSLQRFHQDHNEVFKGDNAALLLRGAKELVEEGILEKGAFICKDPNMAIVLTEIKVNVYLDDAKQGGRKNVITVGFRPQLYFETVALTASIKAIEDLQTGEQMSFMQPGTVALITFVFDEGRCLVIPNIENVTDLKISLRESNITLGGGSIAKQTFGK